MRTYPIVTRNTHDKKIMIRMMIHTLHQLSGRQNEERQMGENAIEKNIYRHLVWKPVG
jgi:hypothetical protein